jgi:hypothetical protein
MNDDQINFTMTVLRPAYMLYRETQVFKLTPSQSIELGQMYLEINGRPMPMCSTCKVEGVLSMVIRAESLQQAQLATDEQKPKRRRK